MPPKGSGDTGLKLYNSLTRQKVSGALYQQNSPAIHRLFKYYDNHWQQCDSE